MAVTRVSTDGLADSAVNSAKIGIDVITDDDLANNAVTANEISSNAVTTAKIAASAVTEAKLGSAAVTEAKLGAAAVTEAKLGAAAVTEAKLGAVAVTSAKLHDDAVTHAKLPAGSVLQVQHHMHGAVETYSVPYATRGAYSNVQKAITPLRSDSKILILISLDGVTWTSDGSYGFFELERHITGGAQSTIATFGYPRQWDSTDNSSGVTMSSIQYDSPNTTSEVTYKFRFYTFHSTSNFNINRDSRGDSTITLMEIKQ